ncbi:MAG: acyl carrier protein [Lachnospira sp.]|nr:acyl carrier protein [Lachnospira sp.]MDD5829187.1 acyl carrier protein [Lachnospira sp.]
MLEKLKELVAQQLGIDEADIKPESNFKDDLNADSLDLFELIMSLEEEYSIEIPSEDLEKLTTVQTVIDYLSAKGVN